MPRQQKIAITILLFLGVFLTLGDRYFFAPTKITVTRDELPVYGLFQILIPGGLEQLGRFCQATENTQNDWERKYYCDIRLTDRYLAFFTFFLAAATIGLGVVSVAGIRRQSKDTRILQRAYISVEPGGIRPYQGEVDRIACDVIIVNAGNLPARNIKWLIKRKYSDSPIDADFKVDPDKLDGGIVLAPKAHARKGAPATSRQELNEKMRGAKPDKAWLYIWGRVSYHDSFRADRWIEFCHRYNLHGGAHVIDAENGRYHEKGNRTDEG